MPAGIRSPRGPTTSAARAASSSTTVPLPACRWPSGGRWTGRAGTEPGRLPAGPAGQGTRLDITAKIGPFRVRSPYEVLMWEPPQRFGGRGVAGPVRFEEAYRLTA